MNARQLILGYEVVDHREHVAAYRREFLPEGLLNPDDGTVRSWLERQGKLGGDAIFRQVCVAAKDPDDEHLKIWARENRAIRGLIDIPQALYEDYRWTLVSAARYLIVRDAQPLTPNVEASAVKSEGCDEEGRPWYASVTMEFPIDFPSGHAAQIIEELQRDAQKNGFAFDVSGDSPTTRRPTNPRNSEIAAFCAVRNDGHRSWADVMQEWNESHPDDAFIDTRKGRQLFAKTARAAYRSIMGPNRTLAWKTMEGTK